MVRISEQSGIELTEQTKKTVEKIFNAFWMHGCTKDSYKKLSVIPRLISGIDKKDVDQLLAENGCPPAVFAKDPTNATGTAKATGVKRTAKTMDAFPEPEPAANDPLQPPYHAIKNVQQDAALQLFKFYFTIADTLKDFAHVDAITIIANHILERRDQILSWWEHTKAHPNTRVRSLGSMLGESLQLATLHAHPDQYSLVRSAFDVAQVEIVYAAVGSYLHQLDRSFSNLQHDHDFTPHRDENTALQEWLAFLETVNKAPDCNNIKVCVGATPTLDAQTPEEVAGGAPKRAKGARVPSTPVADTNTGAFLFESMVQHIVRGFFHKDRVVVNTIAKGQNFLGPMHVATRAACFDRVQPSGLRDVENDTTSYNASKTNLDLLRSEVVALHRRKIYVKHGADSPSWIINATPDQNDFAAKCMNDIKHTFNRLPSLNPTPSQDPKEIKQKLARCFGCAHMPNETDKTKVIMDMKRAGDINTVHSAVATQSVVMTVDKNVLTYCRFLQCDVIFVYRPTTKSKKGSPWYFHMFRYSKPQPRSPVREPVRAVAPALPATPFTMHGQPVIAPPGTIPLVFDDGSVAYLTPVQMAEYRMALRRDTTRLVRLHIPPLQGGRHVPHARQTLEAQRPMQATFMQDALVEDFLREYGRVHGRNYLKAAATRVLTRAPRSKQAFDKISPVVATWIRTWLDKRYFEQYGTRDVHEYVAMRYMELTGRMALLAPKSSARDTARNTRKTQTV